MATATESNPIKTIIWVHYQDNIQLELSELNYGLDDYGDNILVVVLKIVDTVNDEDAVFYFEDNNRWYYTQYLQQYVNRSIRKRDASMCLKCFWNKKILFKIDLNKNNLQFQNLDLLIEGSRIFGENYK